MEPVSGGASTRVGCTGREGCTGRTGCTGRGCCTSREGWTPAGAAISACGSGVESCVGELRKAGRAAGGGTLPTAHKTLLLATK